MLPCPICFTCLRVKHRAKEYRNLNLTIGSRFTRLYPLECQLFVRLAAETVVSPHGS